MTLPSQQDCIAMYRFERKIKWLPICTSQNLHHGLGFEPFWHFQILFSSLFFVKNPGGRKILGRHFAIDAILNADGSSGAKIPKFIENADSKPEKHKLDHNLATTN